MGKPKAESHKWGHERRDDNASDQAKSGGIIDPDRYQLAPEGEAKVSRCTDIPGYRECGEPERTATKYFTDVAAAFWGLYINGQDSNHGPTVGDTGAEERNGSRCQTRGSIRRERRTGLRTVRDDEDDAAIATAAYHGWHRCRRQQ